MTGVNLRWRDRWQKLQRYLDGFERAPISTLPEDRTVESASQWECAQVTFEHMHRNLERADSATQSLLSAVTLSAALAGPLLLLNIGHTALDAAFGAMLVIYIVALGNAIRHALRTVYTPTRLSEAYEGPFHHYHIGKFNRGEDYVAYMAGNRMDYGQHLLMESWVAATVMRKKLVAMRRTVRWTAISLALLGILIIARFLGIFLS